MKTSKEQLLEAIRENGGLHSLQVGSRLFVFDEGSRKQVEKQAQQYAVRSGEMVYGENGIHHFYKWSPVEFAGKTGSARFDWHADGDRVRQVLQKVTLAPGREPVCKAIREEFRKFEVV